MLHDELLTPGTPAGLGHSLVQGPWLRCHLPGSGFAVDSIRMEGTVPAGCSEPALELTLIVPMEKGLRACASPCSRQRLWKPLLKAVLSCSLPGRVGKAPFYYFLNSSGVSPPPHASSCCCL